MTRCRSADQHERGFVLVLVAISSLALLTLVGFGVDLGSWYLNASKLQRAADSAALAGAASLPDTTAAANAAGAAYTRNGLQNGANNVTISTNATANSFSTTVTDNAVPTYFLSMFMSHISLSRTSQSQSAGPTPILGSPYNVLGSGDLGIPNIPTQNFWLAVNGISAPKEDGDYFTAKYDHNKGPFTPAQDPVTHEYTPAAGGLTHCPDPLGPQANTYALNPNYEGAGYSYFISIPKPPVANASVNIEIYDPEFNNVGPHTAEYGPPDYADTLPADSQWMSGLELWDLFNTNGQPQNPSAQTELLPHPYAMRGAGDDTRAATFVHQWWTLYTLPYSEIQNGGLFRVQITPAEDYEQISDGNPLLEGASRGINAFSIGAFPSWKNSGAVDGCDVDQDATCPQVYALNSESVFNNISGQSSGGKADIPLADITPQYVGQTFDVMLWDPGEGTQGIRLVDPKGNALPFTYTSGGRTPTDVGPSSTTPITQLDTSTTDPTNVMDPTTGLPTLSNDDVFNDRLVTMTVTIPSTYQPDTATNDNWLRLEYVVNANTPNDRTTWGIAVPGSGGGGAVHLTPAIP